jgi:uncharacterized damage-inducible protein DinB
MQAAGAVGSELEQYAETLRRAHDGDSWQGSSLSELLAGVTALQAAAHPMEKAHSIWELVMHVAAWHHVVRRRIAGETVVTIPDAENFPLARSSAETVEAIRRFAAARLNEEVPGKGYTFRHMLSGVASHDAYHAGQMAVLKKGL